MKDHKERFLAASNTSRVETDGVFSASLIVSLPLSMYIILFLPLLRFTLFFSDAAPQEFELFSFNVAITVPLVFALFNTVAFAT